MLFIYKIHILYSIWTPKVFSSSRVNIKKENQLLSTLFLYLWNTNLEIEFIRFICAVLIKRGHESTFCHIFLHWNIYEISYVQKVPLWYIQVHDVLNQVSSTLVDCTCNGNFSTFMKSNIFHNVKKKFIFFLDVIWTEYCLKCN